MLALLSTVLTLFTLVLLVRALLSWIPNKTGGLASVEQFTVTVTEPVLGPIRRRLPMVGGFDLSFLVVILGIMVIQRVLL